MKSRAHPYLTRETILGITLGSTDPEAICARFETEAFGRPMLICGYSTKGVSHKIDSTQIVYQGVPLDADHRSAILDVVRFLGGSRGNSTFIELFDSSERLIEFRFRNHGIATLSKTIQPVDLRFASQRSGMAQLAKDFGAMSDAMLALRKKDSARLSAVIHHYNDGSISSYPTSRLRDMSVALEALAGLILGRQTKTTYIMDQGAFTKRMKTVNAAFDAAFAEAEMVKDVTPSWKPQAARDEILKRINGVNRQSPRVEMFEALNSIGVSVTETERETVNAYRNGVLHDGHRGDEVELRTLRRNAQAADLISNLFNRSMLKLLGYRGRYLDAHSRTRTYALKSAPSYRRLSKK